MTWTIVDPRPGKPDEAGDQVRILRWHVERRRDDHCGGSHAYAREHGS